MQMGQRLLSEMKLQMKDINHQNFQDAHRLIERNGETYFNTAVQDVQRALQELYGEQEISLQQLSATFRRGDLIEKLQHIAIQ
jgi:hypothetical protein